MASVTDRREGDALPELRCLSALAEAVARAGGPEDVYREAVQAVCVGLNMDRASLLVCDDAG